MEIEMVGKISPADRFKTDIDEFLKVISKAGYHYRKISEEEINIYIKVKED